MRPYELTGPAYALWHDVGEHRWLGEPVQSKVAVALCAGTHRVRLEGSPKGTADILKELAKRRGVLLHVED